MPQPISSAIPSSYSSPLRTPPKANRGLIRPPRGLFSSNLLGGSSSNSAVSAIQPFSNPQNKTTTTAFSPTAVSPTSYQSPIAPAGTQNNINPPSPATTYTPPQPQTTAYTGQGETPEQIANARTPEQIAQAQGGQVPGQPNPQPTYNTNPYTAGAPTYGGIVGALAGTASQPSQQYNDAQKRYGEASTRLGELQNEAAKNPMLGTGTDMRRYLGVQGLLSNQFSQREAVQTGLMSAAQAAAQTATGQQGVQQSGLGAAAGLAQPVQLPYNSQYVDRITGQPVGGGSAGGSLQSAVSNIVQRVQSGQMTYDQAVQALSGYGQGGLNALQQALGPNFNVNQSNAQGAVQGQQTGQVAQYQSALNQAHNVGAQLTDLIKSFGINPNDVNAANSALQAVARNTSDPHYQALNNYIQSLASLYAQILTPSGGTQTDTVRNIASGMLNSTASGQSILNTISQLDAEAQARIAGVPTTNTGGSSGSSGGATMGDTEFYQDSNGQWHYR